MKRALLQYSAPPIVGGVESVLAHHACLMAANGHEVRLIAGRGASLADNIPLHLLPMVDSRCPEILKAKQCLDEGRLPDDWEELVALLVNELKKALVGVDVLFAHNVCSLNKNLVLTAAIQRILEEGAAPRLILWHHDLAWTTPRYADEYHSGYPWDLLRWHWPGAIHVVVSEMRRLELAELTGIPASEILVIPNGVDYKEFFKLEPRTVEFIDRLDLLKAAPLFLLPVRITPRKNIELALCTLSHIRPTWREARLVVTGPLGPHNPANIHYFNQLIKLRSRLGLEAHAHFLAEMVQDFLPDSVIADFYRLADAVLLPSKEEGFGIPILEAGLAGTPVFCADIPPFRALGGSSAFYFPPNAEPSLIAAQIVRALSGSVVTRQRIHVRKNYLWEQIYSLYISPLIEGK